MMKGRSSPEREERIGWIEAAALAVPGFAGAGLTWTAGHRGFFAFDQSPYFDGAYRVSIGQVPYVDFVAPMGLPVFYFQGALFKLFGVSYGTYVAGAVLISTFAVLLTWWGLRRLQPKRPGLHFLGVLLTALWFQAPFGTPSDVQMAFLLGLGALVLILHSNGPRTLAAAGVLAGLTALSKQSPALYLAPALLVALIASGPAGAAAARRRIAAFLAGGATLAVSLGLFLWVGGGLENFARYFLELPLGVGLGRFAGGAESPVGSLKPMSPLLAMTFALCALSALVALLGSRHRDDGATRDLYLRGTLVLALVLFEVMMITKTRNLWANNLPMLGLIVALATGLALDALRRRRAESPRLARTGGLAVGMAALLATALFSLVAVTVAGERRVHDIFAGVSFAPPAQVPGLRGLRWAQPTRPHQIDVRFDDFTALLDELRTRDEPFFVFPDFTVLYGLADQPSTQPFLWFQHGLTFEIDRPEIEDRRLVESLEAAGVGLIVLEEDSFIPARSRWFPGFHAYLRHRFVKISSFGIFSLYSRREPRSAAAPGHNEAPMSKSELRHRDPEGALP